MKQCYNVKILLYFDSRQRYHKKIKILYNDKYSDVYLVEIYKELDIKKYIVKKKSLIHNIQEIKDNINSGF